MNHALTILLLSLALLSPLAAQIDPVAPADTAAAVNPATTLTAAQLAALQRDLRERRERLSAKAIAYLWDQRLNPATGKIGKVQPRYLQALTVLALAADGKLEAPAYRERLLRLVADLQQPLANLNLDTTPPKLFVGTSDDALAFETHAVVALAYQQLATARLASLEDNQRLHLGTAAAIQYILDYRKRGRTYESAGGWPVNSMTYNRNRPDRRCTAWQLLLLKSHGYTGADVDSTALAEAPQFILAAQRLVPPLDAELQKAREVYNQWAPALRRGETLADDARDAVNRWLAYERQREEAGGFGLDTIGIVTPSATGVGLWTLAVFAPDESARQRDAVDAFLRMPLSWDAQRFFLTQFFAVRGLWLYSHRHDTPDYWLYLNRLVTLMEQKQNADGSFPLGSRGVEELNAMEQVYTTAMCVLILNADRATLLCDRLPY